MGLNSALDRLQRRHPVLGLPIAIVYKYVDDSGGYLAALITYYAFVSLFPLLLLLTTVLGFLLAGDPGLQHRIETAAVSEFPILAGDLGRPRRLGGGVVGLVVGVLGALYGGLGVAQATQHAMNTIWAVPRNSRPNPFQARGLSLVILAAVGAAVLATTGMSALGASQADALGPAGRIGLIAAAVTVNTAIFVFVLRIATTRRPTWRQVLPGAITGAVAWQLLQTFGVSYVSHVIKHASVTNSVFAVVLGLLAFLYLAAVSTIMSAEMNVVRADHLYPRALLTPFTDDVVLTPGDEVAYRRQAQAQRAKGFESIEVAFDKDRDPDI